MGNRIAKHIYTDNQFTALGKSTYYVRDASGNVMAVYDREATGQVPPSSFRVSERHIYGSSRIGMDVTTYEFISTTYTTTYETTRTLGHKQYEISNHLGNVLSVITDQKLPEEAAEVIVSYSAVIITATDYSPFGVGLYGRSWSEGYRYGFNGKEREDALKSNSYDFGARVQSSILGRWLSLDAEFKEYPAFTPYASAGNNPIWALDPDGDRIIVYGQRYGFLGLRRLKYEYTPGAIAPTEASPFVHDAFNSLNYVHKADDAGVIDQVVGHRAKIRVVQSKDTFSRGRKIVWNETDALGLIEKDPNTGIYTKTGFSQSPALGLYHELVHAFRFLFFRKEVSDDLSTVVEEYDDMEEKKVIDNYETPVAKRLGEGIRKNHSGYSIKVESPVITEPIFDMREETEEEMIQKNFEPQNG